MAARIWVAAAACTLALAAASCTSDDGDDGGPTADASAAVLAAAEAAGGTDDVEERLPALVDAVDDWEGPLPPALAGPVLDAFAAHPDALRAAGGPRDPGMPPPAAELDDDLYAALAAAGADGDAAADFRASYLEYVRSGLARSLVDATAGGASWPDVLVQAEQVWLDPSAAVIAAVESGCAGDDCFDRLGAAMDEAQATVDEATYEGMPESLVPDSMLRRGTRVPMEDWTPSMKDDWTRLEDSIPLPEIADRIESAESRASSAL